MPQLRNTLALICCILFALDVHAIGLSEIQVNSKLNEPLNAKIDVYSIPKGSVSTLKVAIASERAFQRAGLERPYVLTNLEFTVQAISKTEALVQISTQEALKEPFLNFIVEVTWASGQILREYTIFLDLPSYKQAAPINRPSSVAAQNTPEESTNGEETSTSVEGDYYTIVRNDTLWKIAEKHRPKGVSVPEQMDRIYNANPNAFINQNKTLLKLGKVIRIPGWTNTERETSPLQSEDATSPRTPEEIDEPSERGTAQQLENKITQLTEENVALKSENEQLTTELENNKDLLVSLKKQLTEKNNRLTLHAQQIANLQAQLETQEKQPVKESTGASKPQVTLPTPPDASQEALTKPESDQELASSSTDQTPEVAESTPPATSLKIADDKEVAPEPATTTNEWLKDNVPGGWITIIVTVGSIVLLLLILTLFRRKRQKSSETLEKFETSKAPKAPKKKRQDDEMYDQFMEEEVNRSDGVEGPYEDVREKFNGYMAQKSFGQAEEFIKSAIKRYPHNHEYHLMLLEIYAAEKKVDQFEKEAKVLSDAVNGQGPLWEKALELRKNLSPERELSQPDSTSAIVGATAIGAAAVAATTLGGNERPNDDRLVIPSSDEEEDVLLFASEEELNQDVNLSEELKGVDAYSDINRTEPPEDDEIQSSAETDDSSSDLKSPEDTTGVGFKLDDDLSGGDEGNLSDLSSLGLEDEFDLPLESGSEATEPDLSSLGLDDEFDLLESAKEGSADENGSSLELDEDLPLENVEKESSSLGIKEEELSLESGQEESAAEDLSSLELDEELSLESGQEESAAEDLSSLELDEDFSLESGQEESVAEDLSSLELDDNFSLESGQEESAADELSSLELDEDFSLESAQEESVADELSSLELDDNFSLESGQEESAADELSLDENLSLDELLEGLDSDDTDNRQETVDDEWDLNALALDKEPASDFDESDTNKGVDDDGKDK